MGLIKAAIGAIGSTVADTFEDYIYCEALSSNTLMQRGYPKSSAGAGRFASDCVISDGSRIAVNDGQFLIVVENGKIVDFTAEQGGYIFRSDAEPSMFCGEFGDKLKRTFDLLLERFAFGGRASDDQRAFFINTKEIMGCKFGFGSTPFRDGEFNITVMLQGFGVYSYRITDPLLFYSNVCGNAESFSHSSIESQMKAELRNSLLPALGRLAEKNICYDKITLETENLANILNNELSELWSSARGITISSLAFSSIIPDDESIDKIRQMQESRVYSEDRSMLGARVGAAQANAMEMAAENPSGSVSGFMGLNLAQQSGGVNVNELMRENKQPPEAPSREESGSENQSWVCSCGAVNDDMFCPECGQKRVIKKNYTCPACGRVIENRETPPKFCPKCGNKM